MPAAVLGATGYVGGTVLQRLREHPTAHNAEITALVRNEKKIPLLASIGVKTLFGTLDDATLLERQASESDIVFACANNRHVQSYEAILRGLKKKYQRTGTVPILFHTSDMMLDHVNGMYASDIIWNDMNLEQMQDLASSGREHLSDFLILEADKQGYVRTQMVIPTFVHGLPTGPLVELGIQKSIKFWVWPIQQSIIRKRAGMVGLGLNRWGLVHNSDLGDLFMVVYDAILDGSADHGLEGMYCAENGECSFREIAERIGEALVEFGVSRPGEESPTPFDKKDYARPGNEHLKAYLGGNSRCIGNRGRMLGWEPMYTHEDLLESIGDLVQRELEHKVRMY